MSSVSSLSLCWTLSLCLLVSVSAVPVNIRVKPGQSVSLPCRAPSNTDIIAAEWTRPGLEPDYVLMYRDGRSDLENQHPSFEGRVELKDGEMKDGDVSMILKNVTRDDAGTYECRVKVRNTNPRIRAILKTGPISTVHLEVQSDEEGGALLVSKEAGDEEGELGVGAVIGSVLGAVLAAGVAAGGGYALYKYNQPDPDQSPYEAVPDDWSQDVEETVKVSDVMVKADEM